MRETNAEFEVRSSELDSSGDAPIVYDDTIISTYNLTKYYGDFKALDDVSLNLKRGRIVGLLGKNGAGKSTLMRCMLGLMKYQGEIYVNAGKLPTSEKGVRVEHLDHSIYENVAFIPDVSEIDERLTVQQTIDYVSGVHPKWNSERAERLFKVSGLPLQNKVKTLSKGMKTKLYLLITLSLDVDVLLLDEPTIGLDIAFRKEFYNLIIGDFFDENKLVLISTHQIEEIEYILQEIIFLHNGKLILHRDIEQLKDEYHNVTISDKRAEEFDKYESLYRTKALGTASALLPSSVKIENAVYSRPQIAEIFLAMTGGYDGK